MDPKSEYLQLCIANILMERDIGTQNIFGEIYLQCDFLLILLCLCIFFFYIYLENFQYVKIYGQYVIQIMVGFG